MMHYHRRVAIVFLLSLCVMNSSCCKPGIKPENANLFQATCGIMTGDFDRQLNNEKQADILSKQKLDKEHSKSITLENKLNRKQTERNELLEALANLEKKNRELEYEINNIDVDSVKVEQERENRLSKLHEIQKEINDLRNKASTEQLALDNYKTTLSGLKQKIETLRKIILAQ